MKRTVTDPPLPPSRFGAGHTVGPQAPAVAQPLPVAPASALPSPSAPPQFGAPPAPTDRVNRLAAVSFILVLALGELVAPVTIPMALAAQHQINRSGQPGAGLAKAALLIGLAYLAIGLTVGVLYLYTHELTGNHAG